MSKIKKETNDDKITKICKLIHVKRDWDAWNHLRHLSTKYLDKIIAALEAKN